MKKWKNLKGWQKGGIGGFFILGILHVLFVVLDIILNEGRAITHPLTSIVVEFPLFVIEIYLAKWFGIIIKSDSSVFIWLWNYFGGTAAWGIVGATVGSILGFLSNIIISNAKRR